MTVSLQPRPRRRLVDLSDEEIVELIHRGDGPAIEHLLARYRSLVEGKARFYFVSGADRDDVIQEGMIGLFKAIRDFQAARTVRFRSFAEVCITRQIISAVKTAARRKHQPLNHYVPLERTVEEQDAALMDVLAGTRANEPETALLGHRLTDYLEQFGGTELSELEKAVIQSRLQGKTYNQMAVELRCPAKSVDNALQRAKRKIWSYIGGPD